MGGKNPFLGIAYVVVGGICIVLGTIFTFVHLVKPRYVNTPSFLSPIYSSTWLTSFKENSVIIAISLGTASMTVQV